MSETKQTRSTERAAADDDCHVQLRWSEIKFYSDFLFICLLRHLCSHQFDDWRRGGEGGPGLHVLRGVRQRDQRVRRCRHRAGCGGSRCQAGAGGRRAHHLGGNHPGQARSERAEAEVSRSWGKLEKSWDLRMPFSIFQDWKSHGSLLKSLKVLEKL